METSVGAHPVAIVSVKPNIKIKTIFIEALMSSPFQWYFPGKTGLFGWKNLICIHTNSMQLIYFTFHIHEHNMKKSFYQYGTRTYAYEAHQFSVKIL
jgi:hypothetical protein